MSTRRSPDDLVARQRTQIEAYLHLLHLQNAALERRDLNAMDEYLAREQDLVHDIELRDRLIPTDALGRGDLTEQYIAARTQHDRNRRTLGAQMEEVSSRLKQIRLPRRARDVYGRSDATGAMLDVTL